MSQLERYNLALAAIATMAVVTFLIRAGGFWMMGRVRLTARLRRMLEALPGSIVIAVVLPIATNSGTAAVIAVSAAIAAMIACRNTLLGVIVGVAAAAMARTETAEEVIHSLWQGAQALLSAQ
jgi:uncharacterized membrane protein